MAKPVKGDLVLIDYTIKVVEDSGEKVVDTTIEEDAVKAGIYDKNKWYGPIAVVLGRSALIDAVEEALYEMEEGETREIEAPPEKAYGKRDPSLVIKVSKKRLRESNIRPVVGTEVEANGRKGRIIKVTERFAYIDFNHPLADKKLKIKLILKKILKDEQERAKYLASRVFSIQPDAVTVEKEDDSITIKLPSSILLNKDLDALMLQLARDIYEYTNVSKLRIVIDIEYRREKKSEKEEETMTEQQTTVSGAEQEDKENETREKASAE